VVDFGNDATHPFQRPVVIDDYAEIVSRCPRGQRTLIHVEFRERRRAY